jgi:hypothetical protein
MNQEFTFWEKASGVLIYLLLWLIGGLLILWQASTHKIGTPMAWFLFFVPILLGVFDFDKIRKLNKKEKEVISNL